MKQTLKISNRKKKKKISLRLDRKEVPLDKYAGKWIAFLGKKIVGNSKNLEKLVKGWWTNEKEHSLVDCSYRGLTPVGVLFEFTGV
jgi:hypothetical protein